MSVATIWRTNTPATKEEFMSTLGEMWRVIDEEATRREQAEKKEEESK